MRGFPDRPFLIEPFKSVPGGIDFLGMRQVNLSILEEYLIPGINNATSDFGIFCLGTWIPWKFTRLCEQDPSNFTALHYQAFREAMEVVMAFAVRDGSPGNVEFGKPRRRPGVQQAFRPPGRMAFSAVNRTPATSIYSAPLYGPALWYLGFIVDYAKAEDGTPTQIPYVSEDNWTREIVQEVERTLSASPAFSKVVRVRVPAADGKDLDDLALNGFHPSFYRQVRAPVKAAFIRKFLTGGRSDPLGERRRLTAALLCETVGQHRFGGTEEIRACWYTRMLRGGKPLVLPSQNLQEHRVRWAIFQARQIQRTIIEGFLRSFELAVLHGCRRIDRIVGYWEERCPEDARSIFSGTFETLVHAEAAPISRSRDLLVASQAWHAKVHGGHERYEDAGVEDGGTQSENEESQSGNEEPELLDGLRMLARWWLRMKRWVHEGEQREFLDREHGRMPIRWFFEWLEKRLTIPLRSLLKELYSDIIFAQHIKVALDRFDGKIQRLRFTLGDDGIVPTTEGRAKLGDPPRRMADRLNAFIGLLCDVGVLNQDQHGGLSPGVHHHLVVEREGARDLPRKSVSPTR